MNSRETLAAVADWLGWQDENLSAGLRNAFDALRLYDYAQVHPNLPEMADDWPVRNRVAALGYDPLSGVFRDADETGAAAAATAMIQARELLDSVAYVAKEGDTTQPVRALSLALGSAA